MGSGIMASLHPLGDPVGNGSLLFVNDVTLIIAGCMPNLKPDLAGDLTATGSTSHSAEAMCGMWLEQNWALRRHFQSRVAGSAPGAAPFGATRRAPSLAQFQNPDEFFNRLAHYTNHFPRFSA